MKLEMRCVGHEHHGNVFTIGNPIEIEVLGPKGAEVSIFIEDILEVNNTDECSDKKLLKTIQLVEDRQIFILDLDGSFHSGYFLLTLTSRDRKYSMYLFINSSEDAFDVAVISPIFTQWAYHADGYYPNHDKLFLEKCAVKSGKLGSLFFRLFNVHVRQDFPSKHLISLKRFYRTNKRWSKVRNLLVRDSIKDGLWCDEFFVTIPVLAWLKRTKLSCRFFSELDLHRGNKDILKAKVIVMYGQEGFTEGVAATLKEIFRKKIPCIFVGMQALGYRQYDYDENSGLLAYVATRGQTGLWGEKLELKDPVWAPEGQLFGFEFPTPKDEKWRYERQFKGWTILKPSDPLFENIQKKSFEYYVTIGGQKHNLISFVGGEYLEKYSPEAEILACLDGGNEFIGCGRYKSNLFFAPTYWPFLGYYQEETYPEIFKILNNGMKWCMDKASGFINESRPSHF